MLTLSLLIILFVLAVVVMLVIGTLTTILDKDKMPDSSQQERELPQSLRVKPPRSAPTSAPPPSYQQTHRLFSAAEWQFFRALREATPDLFIIFGKVRVADVLAPQKNSDRSQWQTSFNKISGKHFDFIVCEADSGRTVCGIELNDRSHRHKKRRERDAFLLAACESAHFPLLVITAARHYDVPALRTKIRQTIMSDAQVAAPSPILPPQKAAPSPRKHCPQCGSPLELKIAERGTQMGKAFLFCTNTPQCQFYRRR